MGIYSKNLSTSWNPRAGWPAKPHICVELRAGMASIIKPSTINLSLSFWASSFCYFLYFDSIYRFLSLECFFYLALSIVGSKQPWWNDSHTLWHIKQPTELLSPKSKFLGQRMWLVYLVSCLPLHWSSVGKWVGPQGYSGRSDKVNSWKNFHIRRWKIMDKIKVKKKGNFFIEGFKCWVEGLLFLYCK